MAALGTLAPERLQALRRVATIESISDMVVVVPPGMPFPEDSKDRASHGLDIWSKAE